MQEYTKLTNAELAVEPEPGKRCALHLSATGITSAVDIMKDATSYNSNCNSD